jgi:hypothetical protein
MKERLMAAFRRIEGIDAPHQKKLMLLGCVSSRSAIAFLALAQYSGTMLRNSNQNRPAHASCMCCCRRVRSGEGRLVT